MSGVDLGKVCELQREREERWRYEWPAVCVSVHGDVVRCKKINAAHIKMWI